MTDSKSNPAADAAETFRKMQSIGLKSMGQMGSAFGADWFEQLSSYNAEVMGFIAERVKTDMAFQQAVLQCRDPAEFHTLQAEFIQTAIEQYTAETGKLVEIGTKMMTPVLKTSEKAAE
ncbi:phasin family protein [Chachezhania sediminis]|uniref:phasin family protein n=1 Tax=Chachezhania sediminis TaxID=2599291 RepID=UPI00131E1B09|nr:phasin family protein [Chachezhania sediminis]